MDHNRTVVSSEHESKNWLSWLKLVPNTGPECPNNDVYSSARLRFGVGDVTEELDADRELEDVDKAAEEEEEARFAFLASFFKFHNRTDESAKPPTTKLASREISTVLSALCVWNKV